MGVGLPLLASEAKSTPSPEFRPQYNARKIRMNQFTATSAARRLGGVADFEPRCG